MPTTKKRIAVIGAGPAGMTAAYELSKNANYEVHLYEAAPSVGGMSKTIDLWSCKVDIGPHRFFSNVRNVNALFLEVLGSDYKMVKRLTRIFYKNRFFYYPLKPLNALINLGFFTATQCVISYVLQRFSAENKNAEHAQDFETWVSSRFGKKLYRIFFKTYSEKLWGISCRDLDADFAAQRIKKLSLWEAIKNAFFKTGGHKTLIDEFAYPTAGTGMIYERMREGFEKNGGTLFLRTPIEKIAIENNRAHALIFKDGHRTSYDEIISSMPLTLMVERSEGVPESVKEVARKLRFRNTIIVYLKVDKINLFPDNWLYIHSDNLRTGRITNYRNWVSEICAHTDFTILGLEYWCNDEEALWTENDSDLIDMAKKEIHLTGLLRAQKAQVVDGFVYRVHRSYPVYQRGYKDDLKPIENYLSKIENLQCIGRYGAFKYNNQDHSIFMGLLAAENITLGAKHDLWAVNTDSENHEDRFLGDSIITDKGLAIKGQ